MIKLKNEKGTELELYTTRYTIDYFTTKYTIYPHYKLIAEHEHKRVLLTTLRTLIYKIVLFNEYCTQTSIRLVTRKLGVKIYIKISQI